MTSEAKRERLAAILARYPEAGRAVYGGEEPAGEAEARAYKFHRRRGRPALEALRLALEDSEAGRRRWPSSETPGLGAPMESDRYGCGGARWAELPESMGFRFAGFADELAKAAGYSRMIEHSGWFLDPDGFGGELARGCVYQLPARDGRPRFIPAIRLGSESRRNGGAWQDQSGSESAMLFLADMIEGGASGRDSYRDSASDWEEALEAARFADGRAERYAEAEREYQEAWQAGRQAAELSEEAAEERKAFLALRAELKAERRSGFERPAICAALESAVRSHASAWRSAKAKAAKLREEWSGLGAWRSHMEEAFKEGLAQ